MDQNFGRSLLHAIKPSYFSVKIRSMWFWHLVTQNPSTAI